MTQLFVVPNKQNFESVRGDVPAGIRARCICDGPCCPDGSCYCNCPRAETAAEFLQGLRPEP